MRFDFLLSGGSITAIVVNPPERKLAKRTSVHCKIVRQCFWKKLKWPRLKEKCAVRLHLSKRPGKVHSLLVMIRRTDSRKEAIALELLMA